jgi:hypothetical protein
MNPFRTHLKAACVAAVTCGVGLTTAHADVTNGGFETADGLNPLGWAENAASGATYITGGTAGDDVHQGTAAVRLTHEAVNKQWFTTDDGAAPVVAGEEYSLFAWVKGVAVDDPDSDEDDDLIPARAEFLIIWEDADGDSIGGPELSGAFTVHNSLAVDDWTEYGDLTTRLTATAPTGAVFAKVLLRNKQGFAGTSVSFDSISLIPEPASASLLLVGGLAMVGRRRRSR